MALPSEPRRKFPDYVAPTKVHYDGAHPRAIQVRTCRLVSNFGGIRREHVFEKGTVRIGAMDDNDLVITDETVSRYHCRIVQEEGGYLLCDLGSTNGTFVNGVRVREAFLNSGSTIGLGQSEVQFFASQEKVEIIPSAKNHLGDIIGNRVLDPRSRRGGEHQDGLRTSCGPHRSAAAEAARGQIVAHRLVAQNRQAGRLRNQRPPEATAAYSRLCRIRPPCPTA